MPVTAANLPIEICNLVLDWLVALNPAAPGPISMTFSEQRAQKRALSACALVCRTWTPPCQKRLFTNCTLRSRDDYVHLKKLVSHPRRGFLLASYVEVLQLWPTDGTVPWLHLCGSQIRLASQSYPRRIGRLAPDLLYPNLRDVRVALHEDNRLFAERGLHHSLPRHSHLSIFSQAITQLSLTQVTLTNISSLLALAVNLPSLRYLVCEMLQWARPPSQEPDLNALIPIRRPRWSATQVPRILMKNCEENETVLFMAYALHAKLNDVAVPHAGLRDMLALLISLTGVSEITPSEYEVISQVLDGHITIFIRSTSTQKLLMPVSIFAIAPDPLDSTSYRFAGIRLNFGWVRPNHLYYLPLSDTVSYAWEVFDRIVTTTLETDVSFPVIVEHWMGLRSNLAQFAKEIEPKLVGIKGAGRLRYVLENGWSVPNEGIRWKIWTHGVSEDALGERRWYTRDEMRQMGYPMCYANSEG